MPRKQTITLEIRVAGKVWDKWDLEELQGSADMTIGTFGRLILDSYKQALIARQYEPEVFRTPRF